MSPRQQWYLFSTNNNHFKQSTKYHKLQAYKAQQVTIQYLLNTMQREPMTRS
jgi:hypothetical protein